MDTISRQLLIDLWGCDPLLLSDQEALDSMLRSAAKAANVTIINSVWHSFEGGGVTGLVLISESHFSVHTWPEAGYVAVDLYVCGQGEPGPALGVLKRVLSPTGVSVGSIGRGLRREPSIQIVEVYSL